MTRIGLACCLAFGLIGPAALAAPPAYTTVLSLPLGAPDRWDYLTFDPASGHVLIAHGDHTDIVDPQSGKVVGRLTGLNGAHGQAVTPDGAIYADSGVTGTIAVFDGKTLRPRAILPAGTGADAVVYAPAQRIVAVMDGDASTATLIDADTAKLRATVKLGGQPEFAAADGHGHLYVNLESTGQVAVLDTASNSVTARYTIAGCDSPHGAAIDPATSRLFVSCRNSRLVVVDTASGRELQTLPIAPGTDAAAFDPVHRLVFSSNGSGTLSVFRETAGDTLVKLGEVPTQPGARTMATDPATGRIFLVTANLAAPMQPGKRPTFKPGTVRLIVLQPKQG